MNTPVHNLIDVLPNSPVQEGSYIDSSVASPSQPHNLPSTQDLARNLDKKKTIWFLWGGCAGSLVRGLATYDSTQKGKNANSFPIAFLLLGAFFFCVAGYVTCVTCPSRFFQREVEELD